MPEILSKLIWPFKRRWLDFKMKRLQRRWEKLPKLNLTPEEERRFHELDSHMGWSFTEKKAEIALNANLAWFGREFIAKFPEKTIRGIKRTMFKVALETSRHESPLAVALLTARTDIDDIVFANPVFNVKIGFEKDAVIMMPQGVREEKQALDRFRSATGMHAANFLVREIEEHARRTGFKEARIVRPEKLYYYKRMHEQHPDYSREQIAEKRAQMKELYYMLARNLGYTKGRKFFVKRL